MREFATEHLAERLVSACGWLTDEERERAINRLARRFQEAWMEEHQRLLELPGRVEQHQ